MAARSCCAYVSVQSRKSLSPFLLDNELLLLCLNTISLDQSFAVVSCNPDFLGVNCAWGLCSSKLALAMSFEIWRKIQKSLEQLDMMGRTWYNTS
jgi:hypothetical protein